MPENQSKVDALIENLNRLQPGRVDGIPQIRDAIVHVNDTMDAAKAIASDLGLPITPEGLVMIYDRVNAERLRLLGEKEE